MALGQCHRLATAWLKWSTNQPRANSVRQLQGYGARRHCARDGGPVPADRALERVDDLVVVHVEPSHDAARHRAETNRSAVRDAIGPSACSATAGVPAMLQPPGPFQRTGPGAVDQRTRRGSGSAALEIWRVLPVNLRLFNDRHDDDPTGSAIEELHRATQRRHWPQRVRARLRRRTRRSSSSAGP